MNEHQPTASALRFYVFTRSKTCENATTIHHELVVAWQDAAPALRTVQLWIQEWKKGERQSLFSDEPRTGRPRSSTGASMQDAVTKALEVDPFLSLRQLADVVGVASSNIHRVMHEMGYRHINAMWVPHKLSDHNKTARLECARSLKAFVTKSANLNSFVIEDETWIYFTHHSQRPCKAWIAPNGDRPQVPKFSPMTNRKAMLLVSFTPGGLFYLQALPHGQTVDGETFVNFLRRMGELWRKRVNGMPLSSIQLQVDNAPAHTSTVAREFFDRRGISLIRQSPYSPDLNLCDRFLFRSLKSELQHRDMTSAEDVEAAATEFMKNLSQDYLTSEIAKLKRHCEQVIINEGCYVDCEKYNC